MKPHILSTQEGGIGYIALNRPEALNALSIEMIDDINRSLGECYIETDINAVCLYSNSEKAFCAGGDIRWLYEQGQENINRQLEFFEREYQLNYRMSRFPKPIISLVNGLAMGGGIGISLHNVVTIASDKAVFAMPETAIGFFPDIGASYLLSRCPGLTGLYLALTGARFNAFDAHFLGLVDKVIDHQVVNQARIELAQCEFTEKPLQDINTHFSQYVVDSREVQLLEGHYDKINTVFDADSVELIMERLAYMDDHWSLSILQDLKKRSPLSLKVCFEQMRRAKTLSLEQCLQMDYVLVQNFMRSCDFYEGVRAMVIDKDKQAKWTYPSLEWISDETVHQFFINTGNPLEWIKEAGQ